MPRSTLAFVLLLLASCAPPPGDEPATPPTTPPTPPSAAATGAAPTAAPAPGAPVAGARSIGPNTRPIMLETLARERGNNRTMWLVVNPGDAEAATLKDEVTGLFQEAGWTVKTEPLTGLRLKPGLVILLAEETPPPYTEVVVEAFETSGLEVKSASGYRAYAEDMKKQNPEWPGIPMTAEQDMVLVIGPKPSA